MKRWTASLALGAAIAVGACAQEENKDFGRRPDWSLTLADGTKLAASDFDGKVLLVDFWATWCGPCKKEIPGFIELKKKYGGRGFEILGFSFDQDPQVHDRWVRDQGVNYRSIVVKDEAVKKVLSAFEEKIGPVEALPTTILVDRAGKIVFKHVGYAPPEEFEKAVTRLLGEGGK